MPYQATVYRVMVASPGDVNEERLLFNKILDEWNGLHSESEKAVILPVKWETHSTPDLSDRPQAIINKQIVDNSDILIGIFLTRIGTPTGISVSGTVEELERFLSKGKRVVLYFSDAPVNPSKIESKQYKNLLNFKKQTFKKGLVETYTSHSDFRDKLLRHLTTIVRELQTKLSSQAISENSKNSIESSQNAVSLGKYSKDQASAWIIKYLNGAIAFLAETSNNFESNTFPVVRYQIEDKLKIPRLKFFDSEQWRNLNEGLTAQQFLKNFPDVKNSISKYEEYMIFFISEINDLKKYLADSPELKRKIIKNYKNILSHGSHHPSDSELNNLNYVIRNYVRHWLTAYLPTIDRYPEKIKDIFSEMKVYNLLDIKFVMEFPESALYNASANDVFDDFDESKQKIEIYIKEIKSIMEELTNLNFSLRTDLIEIRDNLADKYKIPLEV